MTSTTTNLTDLIIDKVKELPLEQQQEILNFAEFISNKYYQDYQLNKPKKKRVLGLAKGKGWMSDDFNEPLCLIEESKIK
jgi:hypothetical protein